MDLVNYKIRNVRIT